MTFVSIEVEFALQTEQNFLNFKKGMVINMRENIEGLPKDEQIKKYKADTKRRLITVCICLPIFLGLSIGMFVFNEIDFGLIFLESVPLGFFFGYILPVKHNNKKIKELEENN